jgi:hypothetical protein
MVAPGIELGPLDLQPETLTTRPQRQSRPRWKLKFIFKDWVELMVRSITGYSVLVLEIVLSASQNNATSDGIRVRYCIDSRLFASQEGPYCIQSVFNLFTTFFIGPLLWLVVRVPGYRSRGPG